MNCFALVDATKIFIKADLSTLISILSKFDGWTVLGDGVCIPMNHPQSYAMVETVNRRFALKWYFEDSYICSVNQQRQSPVNKQFQLISK